MRLDVRSSVLAAVVMMVALVSTPRIGGYLFAGVIALVFALGSGIAALAMRREGTVRIPQHLGRGVQAGAVVLATFVPRVVLAVVEPRTVEGTAAQLQAALHVFISALLSWRLLRANAVRFADAHPVLALAALVLPCQAACWDGIAYPEPESLAIQFAPWLGLALFAAMGCAVLQSVEALERRAGMWLLVLLALGGGVRGCGILASPEPIVDVWAWRNHAPRHLLAGTNPYGAEYPDAYASPRAIPYGLHDPASPGTTRDLPTYPPLPVLASVPFTALGLDVRWADAFCDLLAASLVAAAGFRLNNRAVGLVAAGTYLGYPLAARVIEQSWYEPMLAALVGGGLVLLQRGWRIGGFALGLGLVGKQFGAVLAVAAVRACGPARSACALGVLAAALLTIGPFLLWDARAFLDIILFHHLALGPRFDSLTLTSLCLQEFGVRPPTALMGVGLLVTCGFIAWKTPRCPIAGAAGIGLTLLAFCLFNAQANYNYFTFASYLLLLGLTGLCSWNGEAVSVRPPGAL